MIRKINLTILLIIFLHLLFLVNLQFTAWPEMLSYPYLLKHGYQLYKDIINPYPPFLPYFLLFYFNLLGFNLLSLKLLTIMIVVLIDLLLFWVVRKIFDQSLAFLTLCIFFLLQPILEGNGLWFDLFVTPFLLFSFYLLILILKEDRAKLFNKMFLGIILGLAFLIKQTVGLIFLILTCYLFFVKKKLGLKSLFLFCLCFVIPLIFTSFLIFKLGLFDDYLFWVFIYPYQHLTNRGFQLYPTWKQFLILIFLIFPTFLFLMEKKIKNELIPLFVVFISSLLFAIPRFSYFHLQPSLPFIAIWIALFLKDFLIKKRLLVGLTYFLGLVIIFGYFLIRDFGKEARFYDNKTMRVSLLLKEKLSVKEEVFFYNVSSEYFVLANLLPIKPWADNFPWYLETGNIQERIVQSLSEGKVNYVVFKPFDNNGDFIPGSYRPKKIDDYIQSYFIKKEDILNTVQLLERRLN